MRKGNFASIGMMGLSCDSSWSDLIPAMASRGLLGEVIMFWKGWIRSRIWVCTGHVVVQVLIYKDRDVTGHMPISTSVQPVTEGIDVRSSQQLSSTLDCARYVPRPLSQESYRCTLRIAGSRGEPPTQSKCCRPTRRRSKFAAGSVCNGHRQLIEPKLPNATIEAQSRMAAIIYPNSFRVHFTRGCVMLRSLLPVRARVNADDHSLRPPRTPGFRSLQL